MLTPNPRRSNRVMSTHEHKLVSKDMSLPTASTFHSPPSPNTEGSPVLHIPSLPDRSLTSPKALEQLIQMSERAIDDIIDKFDYSFAGLLEKTQETKQGLIAPAYLKDTRQRYGHSGTSSPNIINEDPFCDSGLGSSLASSLCEETTSHFFKSAQLPTSVLPLGPEVDYVGSDIETFHNTLRSPVWSQHAVRQVKRYIVKPILEEDGLKEFHGLIKQLPARIAEGKVQTLRDFEKTLIFLAPATAKTPESYLRFCEFSIQCLHTTVDHINVLDQRKPADRPYNNLYFVDLVEQVRQYARIMAVTRGKKIKREPLDDTDSKEGEKLKLIPGNATKPAELVREYGGKLTPIDAGRHSAPLTSTEAEDSLRSMARKRKCDQGKIEQHPCRECGKIFPRACDRSKHEKTHSRPWKCPEADCRYHTEGWPTEKECERHVNDKHKQEAKLYKCLFEPCPYTSKRESNCKQHMEKAHDWQYDRCRAKKGDKVKIKPIKVTTKLVKIAKSPSSASTTPLHANRGSYFSPAASENNGSSGTTQSSVQSSPHDAVMQQFDNMEMLKMLGTNVNDNYQNRSSNSDATYIDNSVTLTNPSADLLPFTTELAPQFTFGQNAYNNFVDNFQVYQPQPWDGQDQQYNNHYTTTTQNKDFNFAEVPNPADPGFEQWLQSIPQQYPPQGISPVEDFALYEEAALDPTLAVADADMMWTEEVVEADHERGPSHGLRLGIEEDPVLGQWMNLDDVNMDLF